MEWCNRPGDRVKVGEAGRKDIEARGCFGLSANDKTRRSQVRQVASFLQGTAVIFVPLNRFQGLLNGLQH